jgi:excisionase family DNA binding protein
MTTNRRLTIEEAAVACRRSTDTLRRLIREGKITAIKDAGRLWLSSESVERAKVLLWERHRLAMPATIAAAAGTGLQT